VVYENRSFFVFTNPEIVQKFNDLRSWDGCARTNWVLDLTALAGSASVPIVPEWCAMVVRSCSEPASISRRQ
jgi:hypothetical protein